MPEWFDCARFLAGVKGPASLRLNAAVERAFVKHGTVVTTRLLVLDKVEGANVPIAIRTNGFRELVDLVAALPVRSEEHTSELQSLMRISYAVFCLKKNTINTDHTAE